MDAKVFTVWPDRADGSTMPTVQMISKPAHDAPFPVYATREEAEVAMRPIVRAWAQHRLDEARRALASIGEVEEVP